MAIVLNFSNCRVIVKYLKKVGGSDNWYYVRRIPQELHSLYPLKKDKRIVESTKTSIKGDAVRIASLINKKVELEWSRFKNGTVSSSEMQQADDLLLSFGLKPGSTNNTDTPEFDAFTESIESKIPHNIKEQLFIAGQNGQREVAREILLDTLPSKELLALDILNGRVEWTASLILEEHLRLKGWEGNKKQKNTYNPAFRDLVECLGDRCPKDYTHLEVHHLIDFMLEKGLKTATVKRRMGCIRSAFNRVTRVHELRDELHHPFSNYEIAGLYDDVSDREDFARDQLQELRRRALGAVDDISGLIAVMMETGLRVAEVCGLRCDDVVTLSSGVAYVSVHRNEFRRLKTKGSQRLVPLVGVAKDYALNKASSGWLFPRYVDIQKSKVKNDAASAAVKKRLVQWLGEGCPTSHSFRHTMNTRLRDAGCPKDVRDELGGWAKTVSDKYGSPSDIAIKNDYLVKSLEW